MILTYVMEKDAFGKISMQMKLFIDQLLKKRDSPSVDENLVIFDKITSSITTMISGNSLN